MADEEEEAENEGDEEEDEGGKEAKDEEDESEEGKDEGQEKPTKKDAAVERTDSQDWLAVVFGYLRRILREHIRPKIRLTLGPESGYTMGTKAAINIHKVGEIDIRQERMEY